MVTPTALGARVNPGFAPLLAAIRRNCDIADARHAQDMTLCNYLLAMREYFRWETGLAPDAVPDRPAVGAWIATREARWEELADAPFGTLPLDGCRCDPFDEAAVNAVLGPAGWIYGAARGSRGRCHFFVGRRVARSEREGIAVVEVGEEIARDIHAAPAAYRDGTITLRHDAFERWLWASAEGWDRARDDGPMRAALSAYGFREDPRGAISRMASAQRETLLLHEVGEHRAGLTLGPAWEAWFDAIDDSRDERLARAVRDLLADCLVTLPALAERRDEASLHFWFATFGGLRRALFPGLAEGYRHRGTRDGWPALAETARRAAGHWAAAARELADGRCFDSAEAAVEGLRFG